MGNHEQVSGHKRPGATLELRIVSYDSHGLYRQVVEQTTSLSLLGRRSHEAKQLNGASEARTPAAENNMELVFQHARKRRMK